jgi:hypothetical protein
MHKVQQRRSRVLIYTNYEKDDVNIEGDDDGDGDVAMDDEDDSSAHAKEVSVMVMVLNSPLRQPPGSRICPIPEKKRTFTIAVSEN